MIFAMVLTTLLWAFILPAAIGRFTAATVLKPQLRWDRGLLASLLGIAGGAAVALAGYGIGLMLSMLHSGWYAQAFGGLLSLAGLKITLVVAVIASAIGVADGWRAAVRWSPAGGRTFSGKH